MPDPRSRRRGLHPYATRISREHRIAARVGKTGRDAPPARHVRRGAARTARLRTVLATTLALGLLGGGWAVARTMMGPGAPANGATAQSGPATPGPSPSSAAGSSASSASPGTTSAGPGASTAAAVAVPQKGNEKFTVLSVPGKDSSRSGRTIHYTVEVEGGLTGVDAAQFARTVRSVLVDAQGWEPVDKVHFVNVTPRQAAAGADVDIRISLTSPDSTDKLCAPMQTNGQLSCWNGERAIINVKRWLLGAASYRGHLADYRVFLINHQVGHGLGHQHVPCPGAGERAPVMLQQTLSLQGCQPWPWPQRP